MASVTVQAAKPESFACDCLILGLFQDEKENEFTRPMDAALNKELSNAIKNRLVTGEFGEAKLFTTLGKLPAKHILLFGLGKKEEFKLEQLRRASAMSAKYARDTNNRAAATTFHHLGDFSLQDKAQAITEGTLLSLYQLNKYKTQDLDKIKKLDSLALLEDPKNHKTIQEGIRTGTILAEATNYVRDLVNLPANIITPTYLAKEAEKLGKEKNISVRIFNKKELEEHGFGALLAVSKGSAQEPKFVVLEYNKGAKEKYAFVGKGITFDSGGLDLKPSKYMEDMKTDMAGAASVIGAIKAANALNLPIGIIGAFPACENMPSGSSYHPGDIIIAHNKKTIEVGNTDAEGRLVLCDALSYVEKAYKPKLIIDLATLTGACVVALGHLATGAFTKEDGFYHDLHVAGEQSGERIWRLPMWDEYKEGIKSDIADMNNIAVGYDAGAIEGAVFLSNFVESTPWIHLDIAGTSWFHESKWYLPKGATGVGVRLLVQFLRNKVG